MTTPEAIEASDREWFEKVYRGDRERQLTARSVVAGMVLGSVMSLSNLYSGLKIGWSFGASITSAIIAFALFSALQRVPRGAGIAVCSALAVASLWFVRGALPPAVPAFSLTAVALHAIPSACFVLLALAFALRAFDQHFTLLENNTMQTAASAAGAMSSAGLLSAIPALVLLSQPGPNGEAPIITYPASLTPIALMCWLAAVSYLGVMAAVPLKRQMINIDKLPFPSGTACAVTLNSLHAAGPGAVRKARALVYAAVVGALVKVLTGLKGLVTTIPETIYVAPRWHFLRRAGAPNGITLENLTVGFPVSVLLLGGGALIGMRVALSLAGGAVLNYLVIAPVLHVMGVVDASHGFSAIRKWSLWPGTAMMVTAGLTSFALKWRTIGRAFSGLGKLVGGEGAQSEGIAKTEVPGSWFLGGLLLSGLACVLLQYFLFGIRWWMGVIAVLATLVLSLVAARATGETDVTPTGAMGKITQLIYGVVAPSSVTTNLMTANVTAGAASHSADLLTDLKTGYLVGASARKQFVAQLFGVLSGALLSVPVYNLIANPQTLGTPALPAPAAASWAAVAQLFRQGLHALPRGALAAIIVAGIFGVVIAVLEETHPKLKKYLPSPTGIGIAFNINAYDSLAMFAGALIAWQIQRAVAASKKAKAGAKAEAEGAKGYREDGGEGEDDEDGVTGYIVPISSGLIAGESLMGIVVAALGAFHLLAE